MSFNTTAQRLSDHFYSKCRDNGDHYMIFETDNRDDHDTLLAMTFAANQAGISSDDAYQMTADALAHIASSGASTVDEITDIDRGGLIEIYTAPLMRWLARNWQLADEMHDEYGAWPETMNDIAMAAQDYAFGLVLGCIESNWPADADEEA